MARLPQTCLLVYFALSSIPTIWLFKRTLQLMAVLLALVRCVPVCSYSDPSLVSQQESSLPVALHSVNTSQSSEVPVARGSVSAEGEGPLQGVYGLLLSSDHVETMARWPIMCRGASHRHAICTCTCRVDKMPGASWLESDLRMGFQLG